jgi:hypothetical protein
MLPKPRKTFNTCHNKFEERTDNENKALKKEIIIEFKYLNEGQ